MSCAQAEEASIAALKRGLAALNTHLASHTYLVGHGVTLADIIAVCNLANGFKVILTKSFTSEFPHVERYFWTLINQPNFKKVWGDIQQVASVPPVASKKPAEKPKEEPKKEVKKVEAPKEVVEEEASKPKAKNPLDLLPPSPMILDDWKRLYSNTKTNFREVAIKGTNCHFTCFYISNWSEYGTNFTLCSFCSTFCRFLGHVRSRRILPLVLRLQIQ